MQNIHYDRMRPCPRLTGLISGLLLGIMPGLLTAAELTELAVRTAVETWVRGVTAEARADARIETLEPRAANGRTFAYVAKLAGGGYCLCGADDCLLPVYLYSPRGNFDATDPNGRDILAEIQSKFDRLQKAFEQQDPVLKNYAPELTRRASFWQALASGKVPPPGTRAKDGGPPSTIVLPLTSQWHQRSPYNDACPNLTPGQDERTVVGCDGTAMAQLMYYWKWPPAGTGAVPTPFPYFYRYTTTWLTEPLAIDPGIPASWNNRLVWTPASGGTLSMNGYWDEESVYYSATQITNNAAYLSALAALWARMTRAQFVPNVNFSTPINWNVIRDEHTDPVDDGDAEVAALCYEVGVSVYMHYGIWGSSATDTHIAEALKAYFYYDPDAVFTRPSDAASITEEIKWFRPVEIGGGGPPPVSGGHAWVAYGYNTATTPTQFLMNLGWVGQPPAWYSLDQVFPASQDMTTRIAPLNAVKFVGAAAAGDGSPADPYFGIEQALANASDGTTLVFKAGSDNRFSTPTLTINRPLTLKGVNATIRPL